MGMWACTLQSHAGKLKEIICIKYLVYHGGSARVVFFVLYFSFFLKQEIQGYYPSSSEGRQTENHNHRKLTNLITWITALSGSMKPWAMPCRATQYGWVVVESSDKMWSTGEGNGKPLQYSCLENPMNSMKRQKDRTLKDELPRSVGAQYATGDQWRNNSRKNEETEPKQKQHPVVDLTDDGSKVRYYKKQ